ncbi:MAG: hypothetical protein KAH38_04390 [Candidatus Hydrogenedentes bacterium]|nr:hypothetical protein [Candidatus Hydrogenedentota bacterium]
MKKITLIPNSRIPISVDPPTETRVEWEIDIKLEPAVVERTPNAITLFLDAANPVRPAFYAIDAIFKDNATGQELKREAYMVRVATESDRAATITQPAADQQIAASEKQELSSSCAEPTPLKTEDIVSTTPESPVLAAKQMSPAPVDDVAESLPPVEKTANTVQENTPSNPPPPPLQGEYALVLCRNGVDIASTETDVQREVTITVGKEAACTLSLRSHFPSEELSRKCSRKQLDVFWLDARICVKNIGTNSVIINSTPPHKLHTNEWGYWPENAIVTLPCGLSLRLRKRIS